MPTQGLAAQTSAQDTTPAAEHITQPPAFFVSDAIIIGAGPVGLFQAFQLGLQGLTVQIVDTLPYPGGQCAELYPDKPIYDIPGIKRCTGAELVAQLMAQIEPFHVRMHLGHEVQTFEPGPGGEGYTLTTSAGVRLQSQVVMIAAGVGSFQPRRLKVEGLAAWEGKQLHYHPGADQVRAGQHVLLQGDSDAVIDEALALATLSRTRSGPASVTLVHRRDAFKAAPERVADLRAACAAGWMSFMAGQIEGLRADGDRLVALTLALPDGSSQERPVDTLLVRTGLSPQLGPIADWGLPLARKQLAVDTARFETGVPGIFAVGDINTYPGKRKLIVCGFHEATLAAFAAAETVHPEQAGPLQYTTSSTLLQQRLGVLSTRSADI
jgi:thioredoxin reductase (NADPH)